jgi:Starch-binding associating with outer membrane
MRINKIAIIALAAATVMGTGCKKFLDVNQNPNSLSENAQTMQLTLPSAEYAIAYVVGDRYAEIGGFLSQYWTQSPSATQYYDYDRYAFDAADADREWSQLYAGALKDLNLIDKKATAAKDSNYLAIAKVLQAYTYQVLTDIHGDIPFSETMKAEAGNFSPKYDSQMSIYDGLLTLCDDALVLLANTQTTTPGADDVMFGGDMMMWYKFTNTLKLKILMRQSEIRPVYVKDKLALMSSLTAADYLSYGENAEIKFYDKQGSKNPLYANIAGLGNNNNVASSAIADTLNAWGDLRATAFFDETTFSSGGTVIGLAQGKAAENPGSLSSSTPTSSTGDLVIGATTPVKLMSASESLFLQAEAKARTWMAGDAQTDYEEAILESYTYYNITAPTTLFDAAPYKYEAIQADQLKQIAIQKWVSMCGNQNIESWIETRRTNQPAMTESLASYLNAGEFPARIPYVNGEAAANTSFPGQKALTAKMWWDAN